MLYDLGRSLKVDKQINIPISRHAKSENLVDYEDVSESAKPEYDNSFEEEK